MKFSVGWTPTARRMLPELWLSATDQNAIQEATDEMNRILADVPLHAGESRVVNIRIIVQPPLAAYYDVAESDRRVTVWRIWKIGRN